MNSSRKLAVDPPPFGEFLFQISGLSVFTVHPIAFKQLKSDMQNTLNSIVSFSLKGISEKKNRRVFYGFYGEGTSWLNGSLRGMDLEMKWPTTAPLPMQQSLRDIDLTREWSLGSGCFSN